MYLNFQKYLDNALNLKCPQIPVLYIYKYCH